MAKVNTCSSSLKQRLNNFLADNIVQILILYTEKNSSYDCIKLAELSRQKLIIIIFGFLGGLLDVSIDSQR